MKNNCEEKGSVASILILIMVVLFICLLIVEYKFVKKKEKLEVESYKLEERIKFIDRGYGVEIIMVDSVEYIITYKGGIIKK